MKGPIIAPEYVVSVFPGHSKGEGNPGGSSGFPKLRRTGLRLRGDPNNSQGRAPERGRGIGRVRQRLVDGASLGTQLGTDRHVP